MRDPRLHGFYAAAIVLAFSLSLFSTGALATSREQVIYAFSGFPDCGNLPTDSLIADESGNLYGTTLDGGAYKQGCVFRLSPTADGGWSEAILHSFSGPDGAFPGAALVFDKSGNLYGTTVDGGAYGVGAAFKLSPSLMEDGPKSCSIASEAMVMEWLRSANSLSTKTATSTAQLAPEERTAAARSLS